jgi:hypothetical protein
MLKSEFKVGRYTCELTVSMGGMNAAWSPHMPAKLSKKQLRQYCAGRDALLAKYAEVIGGNIMLVEAS